jgi:hypothetical protein
MRSDNDAGDQIANHHGLADRLENHRGEGGDAQHYAEVFEKIVRDDLRNQNLLTSTI